MRNAEVIRQWSILRDLESSRRVTIDELAERTGVSTRTIRRDLEALQSAGFPLFDELYDGKKYWTLEQRAFRRLDETGFTLAELTALYFSRSLVECLAATPFQRDVRSAFDKLAGGAHAGHASVPRSPAARHAGQGRARQPVADGRSRDARDRVEAGRAPKRARGAAPRGHASPPPRVHALPLVFEQSRKGIPDRAVSSGVCAGWTVRRRLRPQYKQLRTFAIERILSLSVTEDRFDPVDLPEDAFAHSLGVNQGPPERVQIVFEPHIARYVKERIWHSSQQTEEAEDGTWP